ncbi:MAG: aspartate/tyrosine/aromatic aminotransferase [Betaproteobacteria bacterium]|nr:aspartate/tyrosine/aromatic aminotransferase [Betaproteobacteria bacterium]
MSSALFADVALAPRDPILGLTEAFVADNRPNKVNLGVGVYLNNEGKVPLLDAVRHAERERLEQAPPRGYLPIEGFADYNKAVLNLLFANNKDLIEAGRCASFEALGGTGGLKIGADFIKRMNPEATVWISDPSWENHRALFEAAGFTVKSYAYYDAASHGVRFEALLADIQAMKAGDVIVLHACCHNPTGVDLTAPQWREVIAAVGQQQLIPFLDMAYQGFAEGIAEDAIALNLLASSGQSFFVSSSFSKSFSLYGERIGALSVVTQDKDETARVVSQVKRVIRTNYSSPPTHGAAVVAAVLSTPALREVWERELGQMRERIREMRRGFVDGLKSLGVQRDFSFVIQQRGMFSYSGLSSAQVDRLREEFGIYAVSSGRICLAALNTRNLGSVCEAVAKVL